MICQTILRHNRNLHAIRVIKYANHEVFSYLVLSVLNILEHNFCSLINKPGTRKMSLFFSKFSQLYRSGAT